MPTTIIDASRNRLSLNLKELIAYRDLMFTLAYRDLRVRYAQTFLGFLWAFLQPVVTLTIFTLVFGRVARVDTGSVPYPLFALCGMTAWNYFSSVMSGAGSSIIGAQGMISKIYFPRLVIPLSKSLVSLVDFLLVFVLMIALMIWYGVSPGASIVFLPLFLALALISGLAVGIWLSALTVRFRDFQHIIPFAVQLGMYATPVAYPANLVPPDLQFWYFLNPMAGVVEGFRWSLLGGPEPGIMIFVSASVVVLLLIAGLYYFRKVESVMADIV
ncbi:MAG: ABC transporter permease [Bacteroidetes bacterium]|nr:ABC transporter permease [Bacteroidota bacterium]